MDKQEAYLKRARVSPWAYAETPGIGTRGTERTKEVLVRTVLGLASPEVAEIISEVGFDWVWIDMEHAAIDLVQAQIMTQALREGCASVIRVPWNDSVAMPLPDTANNTVPSPVGVGSRYGVYLGHHLWHSKGSDSP